MKQEVITQNELISKKDKKVCTTLNYIEHFFIFASAITEFQFLHSLLWLVLL